MYVIRRYLLLAKAVREVIGLVSFKAKSIDNHQFAGVFALNQI
jgi:hypothetical protein